VINGKEYLRKLPDKYSHAEILCVRQGDDDLPAVEKMRLSDSFIDAGESDEFEWTATMYNPNHKNNSGLLFFWNPIILVKNPCFFV